MFKTKITFKGEERTLAFSTWVMGELEILTEKGLIKFFAKMLFFGLIQGEELRNEYMTGVDLGFNILDCFDWVDEVGGLSSEEVDRVQKLYTLQATMNVPKEKKQPSKNVKATTIKVTPEN